MMDVRRWLADQGFERFADLFEENEIDGEALVHLEDEHLKEMGLPLGPRVKLLRTIASLKVPPAETPADAAEAEALGAPSAPAVAEADLCSSPEALAATTAGRPEASAMLAAG